MWPGSRSALVRRDRQRHLAAGVSRGEAVASGILPAGCGESTRRGGDCDAEPMPPAGIRGWGVWKLDDRLRVEGCRWNHKRRSSRHRPSSTGAPNTAPRFYYIQPGRLPDQNAYIGRFNRRYRTEVLNAHLFESVGELRVVTDTWLPIDNGERTDDRLGRVPPLTFLPEAFVGRTVSWRCLLDGGAYWGGRELAVEAHERAPKLRGRFSTSYMSATS